MLTKRAIYLVKNTVKAVGLNQNICSVGWHSIFNFEIRISFLFFLFFFEHLASPRNGSQLVRLAEHLQQTVHQWKTFVLTFSMHVFHEKNLLLWAHLPHIYIWNNEFKRAKDATWTNPLLPQNQMRCMRFLSVNCPEMRAKVLERAVALVVQTRCADVKPLWESEREKTRYSWITHAVFKWLI